MVRKRNLTIKLNQWLFPFQQDESLNAATRQRATIFSGISFVIFSLLVLENLLSLSFFSVTSSQIIRSLIATGFIFITFLLNRKGWHNTATVLFVSTLSLFIMLAAFRQEDPAELVGNLYWLTIVIVTAGLITSTRMVIVILTALLGFISYCAIQDPELYELGLFRVIGLLTTCGIAVAVYARILADKVNKEAERSAELAYLNNKLEDRVQQRTYELKKANLQLQVEMEERAKTEATLRQSTRLESLGLMASRIAHDFNNWLSAIAIHSSIIENKLPADHSVQSNIKTVAEAADEASGLTQQLLAYASNRPQKPERFALDKALKKWTLLVERAIPKEITFQTNIGDDLFIMADKKQIQQVVMNLIINSSQAVAHDDGAIALTSNIYYVTDNSPEGCFVGQRPIKGEYVTLAVQDNGCGMDPEIIERIFDPFFTTKPLGQGTGLGLSSVLGIVRSCNGYIAVCSTPNVGTTFTLYLPVAWEYEKKDSAESLSTIPFSYKPVKVSQQSSHLNP